MRQFNVLFRWGWTFLVATFLTLGLAGCEGDDGTNGAAGAAGAAGPAGPAGPAGNDGNDGADGADGVANVTPLESCGVCHSEGSFASAPAAHMLDPIESVSNVAFAVNGADLEVTFDLAVDGRSNEGYDTMERGYRTDGAARTDICESPNSRGGIPCLTDNLTLADNGGGNYTITVTDGATIGVDPALDLNNRYLFRVADSADDDTGVYLYGDTGTVRPVEDLAISAQACNACHGPEGIGVHGGYYAAEDGGEPCLTCHGVGTTPSLAAVAHEYHSGLRDEITYPTYMTNCSVCHADEDQLAAVNEMPVSGEGCFTCHGSMDNDSWDFSAGLTFHEGYDETTNCGLCHGDNPETEAVEVGIAPATVAAFHNGAETGRGGVIWDGVDTSVAEGAMFDWQITGVVDDGTNLAISWTASYEGLPVNPCNDVATLNNPVFFRGDNEEELSMYRSYAQGDDFIIGTSTSGPGQPQSVDLTFFDAVASPDGNTACQGGVATTTLPVDDIVAEKGRLGLGGKPLVLSSLIDPPAIIEARVPTPTYDWLLGDGEMVARRNVVDTGQCLGCHVGSLYQHGGDRVDNVDMCLICHNSASNEKYRRVAMGVDASEAYDGKTGETFEMKTMLHRIHSAATEDSPPYVIYRSRGIYAFAPDVSDVPNWDVLVGDARTAGCTDTEIARGERLVFGGDPESSSSCQPHNFHSATYPRSLNECTACHTEDFMVIPDQTQSMATTTEAGSDQWENQLDDTLQGAATTACVTCHKDGAAKGHAYQNSWTPQVFPEGRQTIIDAVN